MMLLPCLLPRRLLSTGGAFILLLLSQQIATRSLVRAACPCAGPSTILSSVKNNPTVVFSTILDKLAPPTNPSAPQYYRAAADGVVKGCDLTRDTIYFVKTASAENLCGVTFLQQGTRYVLFGSVTKEAVGGVGGIQYVLTVDTCSSQSALATLDRQTQGYLYNQPPNVCQTSPALNDPTAAVVVRPDTAPGATCQSCPMGFFDGCNTCGCNNGFATFCSANQCSTYTRPYCTNLRGSTSFGTGSSPQQPVGTAPRPVAPSPPAPVATRPVSQPVRSYTWPPLPAIRFNAGSAPQPSPTVNVVPRPAPTPNVVPRPAPVRAPTSTATTTVAYRPGSVSCAACGTRSFYDGCNVCTCLGQGQRTCTQKKCQTYETPVCGVVSFPVAPAPTYQFQSPPTAPTVTINCQTCPRGFTDGCNSCGCSNTGMAFCTSRACSGPPQTYRCSS